MTSLRAVSLRATIFFSGAVILAVEVMAVRILSPYFGNTIFNFSSVISVILAALSAGYWYGGRLADNRPSERFFYSLVALAGVSILLSYAIAVFLLPFIGNAMPLTMGPLLASLFLFFVPGFLFGLLSPFVIKLASVFSPEKGVGTIAGEIFFFSTLGSIFGSLSAGFILIPSFGIAESLSVMGAAMVALGIIGMWRAEDIEGKRPKVIRAAVLILFTFLSIGMVQFAPPVYADVTTLYQDDGLYGGIIIAEGERDGKLARMLYIDRSFSSAVFLDDEDRLPFEYMNVFSLYSLFQPNPQRVLVLGSAVGAVPKQLLASLPGAYIDAVEIEPSLAGLGERFFGVPSDPRLTNIVDDGRRFLVENNMEYDVIIGDAYHSVYSVPWHMTTVEFYKEVYADLSANGVYLMNVISMFRPEVPTMLFSTIATMEEVFDTVHVFEVRTPGTRDPKNFILIGVKGSGPVFPGVLESADDPYLRSLYERYVSPSRYQPLSATILTDNYAPVDALTGALLIAQEFD